MSKLLKGEEWIEIEFKIDESPLKKYAVTNHGRVFAYRKDPSEGKFLRGGIIGGYPSFKIRINRRDRTYYIHKLVGEYFVPGRSEERQFLIHIDHDKENNMSENLRWVTREESLTHRRESPVVQEARRKQAAYRPEIGHKLTSTDVLRIKRKIWDPNRKTRLRLIAKQFGISEMQLYRIKSGENWSHVRVENEPEETLHFKKKQS